MSRILAERFFKYLKKSNWEKEKLKKTSRTIYILCGREWTVKWCRNVPVPCSLHSPWLNKSSRPSSGNIPVLQRHDRARLTSLGQEPVWGINTIRCFTLPVACLPSVITQMLKPAIYPQEEKQPVVTTKPIFQRTTLFLTYHRLVLAREEKHPDLEVYWITKSNPGLCK